MISKLRKCIDLKQVDSFPIWFMRQAGRYLPEFQKIRKQNSNFIKLCLNEKLSAKLSIQPIDRFDLDAAIIFSDILIVPYALGQKVNFIKGTGPSLNSIKIDNILKVDNKDFSKKLFPVYKGISLLKKKLKKDKSLIAFVGSPWTLLLYMLHKKSPSSNFDLKKILKDKYILNELLEKLHNVLCLHIDNQIKAGADVIQIFDSWAGILNKKNLLNYCFAPNLRLSQHMKKKGVTSIFFPKGIKKNYKEFTNIVKPDCINIDYEIDPIWAINNLENIPIQGGLNPNYLLGNEKKLFKNVYKYLNIFKGYPYVFNLGHGILPKTRPETISKIVKTVRNF